MRFGNRVPALEFVAPLLKSVIGPAGIFSVISNKLVMDIVGIYLFIFYPVRKSKPTIHGARILGAGAAFRDGRHFSVLFEPCGNRFRRLL